MAKGKKRADDRLRRFYDAGGSVLGGGGEISSVRMKLPKPRRLVALRLDEDTLADVRRLAIEKGLNYSTLMRMWITERLRQERQP